MNNEDLQHCPIPNKIILIFFVSTQKRYLAFYIRERVNYSWKYIKTMLTHHTVFE